MPIYILQRRCHLASALTLHCALARCRYAKTFLRLYLYFLVRRPPHRACKIFIRIAQIELRCTLGNAFIFRLPEANGLLLRSKKRYAYIYILLLILLISDIADDVKQYDMPRRACVFTNMDASRVHALEYHALQISMSPNFNILRHLLRH